ncbi:Ribosomal-protein-alanine acetyltransferase [Pediococcus damnosus]|uniref:Ribosomal-protein-alanine acetyltransferase n=1 Tax=Pediococcus damnosus TaxID=51663 RepID=A0A0R2HEY3_9LACO|nr:GNAT family protein [Pediococcus damnosus]AMV60350.1 Ribosomal-protein-alanine acetyltransferase [Pediococcus damnosus]AMV62884.1 Ribosomal-protein-alanine acetyltransferase [Pediococcus damnosus]AMV64600.1 Ribosomal-protein-alanine acetyltransferase [Pediococcus damnosus]AMV67232.1 Ribosomal-protein-alanine acetyltransferase [Pediococcus damnosus]AMV69536.1 Ribosomal-protein-alanine acetyltransferase [Pediococcus damnosus]
MARIVKMTTQQANEYLDWQYSEPYTFYNFPTSVNRIDLLNELLAGISDYYAILDDADQLFGIYEYQFHNGILEIGLGIRPKDTGKGFGTQFVQQCLAFAQQHYHYFGKVTLEVASFNQRAIHLFHILGFNKTGEREGQSFGKPVTFVKMSRIQ